MRSHTVEVSGKDFKSTATTVNLARVTRNATSSRQDFQPEIQAEFASTSRESAVQNDEHIFIKDESPAIQNPTEQPAVDPNMSAPFWDSTKIENPQQTQEDSPISEYEESKPNPTQDSQREDYSEDRRKEAERLQKAVSVLHLNRVLGTPPPASRRAFNGLPEPFERQRALGFPNLITNTLDNFHHQLDWSRFEAFF